MMTIGGQVQQIIDDVAARGAAAESHEGQNRIPDQIHLVEAMSRQERNHNEEILQPVFRTERPQIIGPGSLSTFDDAIDVRAPLNGRLYTGTRVHDDGSPRGR